MNATVYGRGVSLLSELGNNATPGSMDVGLSGEGFAKDSAIAGNDGDTSVVTARFNAKDYEVRGCV